MTDTKSYKELCSYSTYKDRYLYLKLESRISDETFGSKRYINQDLYHHEDWLLFRNRIIARDLGCDLAINGLEIPGFIIIHHLNPITINNILNHDDCVFDADNVVCTSLFTHNAIHFGRRLDDLNFLEAVPRTKNDTIPWKK